MFFKDHYLIESFFVLDYVQEWEYILCEGNNAHTPNFINPAHRQNFVQIQEPVQTTDRWQRVKVKYIYKEAM